MDGQNQVENLWLDFLLELDQLGWLATVKSDETSGKVRLRRVAVKRGERRNGGGDKRQPKQCNAAKTDPLSGWASLSRDGASCCIYSGGLGTFGLWRVRATCSNSHLSWPCLGGSVPGIESVDFNTSKLLIFLHVSVCFPRRRITKTRTKTILTLDSVLLFS